MHCNLEVHAKRADKKQTDTPRITKNCIRSTLTKFKKPVHLLIPSVSLLHVIPSK